MNTPRGNRLRIGIFGRMNVGKSSFLNSLLGQDISIVSSVAGTTTDVVEKSAELLPIGPVTFLDTAGLDDRSLLGMQRVERSMQALASCNIAVLVTEPNHWDAHEQQFYETARKRQIPLMVIVNKTDVIQPDEKWLTELQAKELLVMLTHHRDSPLAPFKERLRQVLADSVQDSPMLLADLLSAGQLAVLVVPIDLQAPKGRLILPQVQVLREVLDLDACALVVKERELNHFFSTLGRKPDLVICDSQAILKVLADTPQNTPCTTFSILLARAKGDLPALAKGASTIRDLKPGDRVLIAESCTHHALADDIGQVKIPRWLRQSVGGDLDFTFASGRDFPTDLGNFRLIIQCGSCTLTRKEVLNRIFQAQNQHVPITNYGLAIAATQGVLDRVLEPFL